MSKILKVNNMERQRPSCEPYKIKIIKPINVTTREQRQKAMVDAGYNTFLLQSEDVFIDLLTDSVIHTVKNAKDIKGLRFMYEPEKLRFFQGRFESID